MFPLRVVWLRDAVSTDYHTEHLFQDIITLHYFIQFCIPVSQSIHRQPQGHLKLDVMDPEYKALMRMRISLFYCGDNGG